MNKHQLKIPLKNSWGELRLIPGKKGDSFEDIELPPVGKFDDWGKDNSQIKIRMDDLRVSEASFRQNLQSNPAASDGMEFRYDTYSAYLKEMYGHMRSLGFKGIITTCGPDTENYYTQRAGANKIVDAVSGGTSYWNRSGYGFLRSLDWLNPMIHQSTPDKPLISREYGPNLVKDKCWWGNLIAASVQKAMGKAYLYNFALGLVSTVNCKSKCTLGKIEQSRSAFSLVCYPPYCFCNFPFPRMGCSLVGGKGKSCRDEMLCYGIKDRIRQPVDENRGSIISHLLWVCVRSFVRWRDASATVLCQKTVQLSRQRDAVSAKWVMTSHF